MSSKILKIKMSDLDGPLKTKLKQLFPRQNINFDLIYRATEHGFGVIDFHEKFDKISNTLTLIESTNRSVFGGFIKVEWDSDYSGYKTDQNAFIFGLDL